MDVTALTDSWYERIDNVLEVQKSEQLDIIPMRFTRTDLLELRLLMGTLNEISKGGNHGKDE